MPRQFLPNLVATMAILLLGACQSVALAKGPAFVAVPGYGTPAEAADAAMQVDPSMHYRVVFPATRAGASAKDAIPALERAARFVNLLGNAGQKTEPGDVVVVLYGPATPAVLVDAAWRARHPEPDAGSNPNLPLIRALRSAGVVVSVCSQALAGNRIAANEVDPSVRRDLSAMTTLAALQARGYVLIPE